MTAMIVAGVVVEVCIEVESLEKYGGATGIQVSKSVNDSMLPMAHVPLYLLYLFSPVNTATTNAIIVVGGPQTTLFSCTIQQDN